jgi:hypothetical protein
VAHPQLRAFFAWVPMLPADTEAAAKAAGERFAEARASHYWDAHRHLSREMGSVLGVGAAAVDGLAWDVYLAYPRGEADIRRPEFWMHQLDLAHAPRLNPSAFRQRVSALLNAR